MDPTMVEERLRSQSQPRSLIDIKKKRVSDMLDEDQEPEERAREKIRSASRSRSKGYKRELGKAEIKGQRDTNKLSKKWRTQDKKG